MTEVISVRFRGGCKNYFFDPKGLQVKMGDQVIVETAQGPEFATCTEGNHEVADEAIVQPLCAVLRMATEADGVDLSLLVPCAPEKPDVYREEIECTIDAFASEDLKKIVREMLRLAGPDLTWFPAAQRLHHAERTGLLHHTCSMLNTAEHIIEAYPFLHGDLLRAGVILHDLSKISEMKSDNLGNVTDYTREGLLIGHLVRGVARLAEAAKNVGVTGEIVVLLEHMIISHHGIPEYGSPKPPMFPEAEVLNWIDTLDARMNEMEGIMARTPAGAFSEKIWSLDRRLYHPYYADDAE